MWLGIYRDRVRLRRRRKRLLQPYDAKRGEGKLCKRLKHLGRADSLKNKKKTHPKAMEMLINIFPKSYEIYKEILLL